MSLLPSYPPVFDPEPLTHLALHCRPGFEKECVAEFTALAHAQGDYGFCKTQPHSALVIFQSQHPMGVKRLMAKIDFRSLIFVRQWQANRGLLEMDVDDRISGLLSEVMDLPPTNALVMETADTNEGKALGKLGKSLLKPLTNLLDKRGKLRKKSPWALHITWVSGTQAYVGLVPSQNAAYWPMGIPRLKVPKAAPSRATLKLEEAWHHFIPAQEWDERLGGGVPAVDLGAAPGGWTWQLVNRGMFVSAVDNGPMHPDLMASGQVHHVVGDGFMYHPPKPVVWMVCDIADKPARTATMIGQWLSRGWCRETVFNLKLPMQKRYDAVMQCKDSILSILAEHGIEASLQFKQLYHDREEVTGHARLVKWYN